MFHLSRFIGVGRVSEPLLRMNDKWPAGRPSTILFHNLHSRSSSILPDSLHWTVRDCNLLSRFSQAWLSRLCFTCFLLSTCVSLRESTTSLGMSICFRKVGLFSRWLMSWMAGSVDFVILQISDNLAIVLEWESGVMFNVSG